MGFFDRFVKKQDIEEHSNIIHNRFSQFKDTVVHSFSNIKKDIDVQRQWVAYLHNIHNWLQHTLNRHKDLTQKDLDQLKLWISYLHEKSKKHEAAMKSLEKDLRGTVAVHHKYIAELYKKIDELSSKGHKVKQDILVEVNDLVQEKHDEAKKHIEKKHDEAKKHIESISEKVDKLPHYRQPKQQQQQLEPSLLTNPEQKLLNLMLAEPDPVSYTHIAEKTGNSINTVRVIMNTLKKRGLIEEHILPSGVKLFNAPNKEKIKKLYNIEHL